MYHPDPVDSPIPTNKQTHTQKVSTTTKNIFGPTNIKPMAWHFNKTESELKKLTQNLVPNQSQQTKMS